MTTAGRTAVRPSTTAVVDDGPDRQTTAVTQLNIVVHYNVERGFEEAALMLARRLFAEFDEAIDSLALIPVAGEDLDLHLNGRLVHSASRSGRLPRVADLLAIPEAAACARSRSVNDATHDASPAEDFEIGSARPRGRSANG